MLIYEALIHHPYKIILVKRLSHHVLYITKKEQRPHLQLSIIAATCLAFAPIVTTVVLFWKTVFSGHVQGSGERNEQAWVVLADGFPYKAPRGRGKAEEAASPVLQSKAAAMRRPTSFIAGF